MRHPSFGKTRKKIILGLLYSLILCIVSVVLMAFIPAVSLGDNELEFLKTVIGPLALAFIGFFGTETYNEHSARKNKKEDDE